MTRFTALAPELLKTFLRSGLFAGFVALGLAAQGRDGRPRRRVVLALVVYTLGATALAGFSQVEAWPFSNWALVHTLRDPFMDRWDLIGLDDGGRVFVIDPRVLEPFAPEEFHTWIRIHFLKLDPAGRQAVANDILRRAERGRLRFLATGRVGTNERLLGPLTAPRHFHRAAVWKGHADVPATPFRRLQIRVASWDIERAAADPTQVRREVVFESR